MADLARCGAKTRGGTPCKKEAGWGTDHLGFGNCRLHFGATPSNRVHAAREAATAAALRLGMAVDTDPEEALLLCVQLAAGEVGFLRQGVKDLLDDEAIDEAGNLHPTARAFRDARDTLARHSKLALDAGIEERRLKLVEGMAERVAMVLRLVVDELDLSPDQQLRLREAMTRHLPMLDVIESAPRELAA